MDGLRSKPHIHGNRVDVWVGGGLRQSEKISGNWAHLFFICMFLGPSWANQSTQICLKIERVQPTLPSSSFFHRV